MFIPIHLQPIYRHLFRGERYPVAEALCCKGLYLPSGPRLSAEEIDFIAAEITEIQCGRHRELAVDATSGP
jgi:perosamine synthetase